VSDAVATASITHRLDNAGIQRLLTSPSGGVSRDLIARGQRVQGDAKRRVGVDTGRLRASIVVEVVIINGGPGVRVGTRVRYARWHHDGTGIHGPRGVIITPRVKKFLRFKPRGAGRFIYVRSVKGAKGTRFLTLALPAARR
jgi:Bacteriophage HK97-gp10, putative tail-component